MFNLYLKKGISKNGKPYCAIVMEDFFGTSFVTFDTNIIMRMSGYTAQEIFLLDNGCHKFKEV